MEKKVHSITFKSYVPDYRKNWSTGHAITIGDEERNLRVVYKFDDGSEAVEFFNPANKYSLQRLAQFIADHSRITFDDVDDVDARTIEQIGQAGAFDVPIVVDVTKRDKWDVVEWKEWKETSEDEAIVRAYDWLPGSGCNLAEKARAYWDAVIEQNRKEREAEEARKAEEARQAAEARAAYLATEEGQAAERKAARRRLSKRISKARKHLEANRAHLSELSADDEGYATWCGFVESAARHLADLEAERAAL